MKNTVHFTLALVACFMMLSSVGFAQDDEGHIFVISTFKGVMPEGGSSDDRDNLMMELIEAQKSNKKVVSSMTLRHRWGSDSRDWVFITEYKSMDDFLEALKIDSKLNKKKWKDDEGVTEFFRKLGKYFTKHSDEIYIELPKFGQKKK
ncbi:MAG: hypothetical protein IH825_00500 [Candidatus Marinimicrobia bacterium]|nr:hypothetical protein [Candidatus Neomarinimicrobiota bacterium]